MPDVSAAIDRLNLPSDEEKRLDMLHDYFPDHLIQVKDTSTHCYVCLQRSNYDYCEDLGRGLGWLGVNRDDVRNFYVSGSQSFLCLLESWIPYEWSMFLANNDYRPQSIAVIHLDDHTDMMSPKIGQHETGWKDMLTHCTVDMCSPKTMKQAVMSGAITLGSMMTPLLHHIDRIDVFYLAYGRSRAFRIINRTTIADDLLDPGRRRMVVDISSCRTSAQRDASRYFRTPEIAEIVNAIDPMQKESRGTRRRLRLNSGNVREYRIATLSCVGDVGRAERAGCQEVLFGTFIIKTIEPVVCS